MDRLLLVEHNPLFREGLATLLEWRTGLSSVIACSLAEALVRLAGQEEPPLRFAAGADAIATVEQKANELLAQAEAHRDLSVSLAIEEA